MPEQNELSQSERARQQTEYLVVGRVVRPHGVRGVVLVEPHSQVMGTLAPRSMVYLGDEALGFELESSRLHQGRWMLTLAGVSDRDQAEGLRGMQVRVLFQEAAQLDEHEYYHWQILDLPVYLDSGELLGEVVQILETGANDVYVVRKENDEEVLLPAIESVILDVDLVGKRMTVHMLPGL
jgi:16S rRNA processing protein RimM